MRWSLKLFTVRGIVVRIHASFALVVLWAAYVGLMDSRIGRSLHFGARWPRDVGFMVLFVLLLFACVLLHELGHALVAQLFGVRVQDITLWPIGGIARMAKLPESPLQEFLITAAGPATNVMLAGVLGIVLIFWVGPAQIVRLLLAPSQLALMVARMNGQALLMLLVANNLVLALFNLLPAFPMDGGRLLRSLLAAMMPFPSATRIASIVGQLLAVMMLIASLALGNLLLGLVAVFIFLGAAQERQHAVSRASLSGLRVQQILQPVGPRLHPLQTLGDVAAQSAALSQAAFLVVDAGRLMGVLAREDLLSGLRRSGPEARVLQVMRRDLIRLNADAPVSEAHDQLIQGRAWAGVVMDGEQVIGTLSQRDLLRVAELLEAYPGVSSRV